MGRRFNFSQFDTKIGIASASHIGSVQDLLSDTRVVILRL